MGIGAGSIILAGNTVTPGNVVISTTSADALVVKAGASLAIQGIKFQTTTSGSGLKVDEISSAAIGAGCQFGACATQHIFSTAGSTVLVAAGYTITGNSPIHWNASLASKIFSFDNTIDATGRAFSGIFATATENSIISVSGTMTTASSTGTRYYLTSGSFIQTFGAGETYLPGNAAGYADAATLAAYL